MKTKSGVCGLIAMLFAAVPALAQSVGNAGAHEQMKQSSSQIVTRVYNVGDLMRQSPNYPFLGVNVPEIYVGKKMAKNLFEGPDTGSQHLIQVKPVTTPGLIKLILGTIDSPSWQKPDIGISMQGDLLIVSQTQEQQARIEQLLKDMRAELRPARMVTIRADWILLEPNQLDTITKPLDEKTEPNLKVIDLAAVQKLNPKVHYRGEITCFDGETVSIASVEGHTAVTDVSPVVAQSAVSYSPTVKIPQAGATLQIEPDVARDGASAVIDVQSLVSEVKNFSTTEPKLSDLSWQAIDKFDVQAQQLKTTMRIPLGKPILIGGMTVAPNLASGGNGQLYLVIELTASVGQ